MRLPDMTPILSWYDENARKLPWRETRDPYRIWISEIMLQQTRVEAVKRYYERFLARLPDVAALAECPEEELLKLWEGLGYYSRARNLQKAAKTVISDHGGEFPRDFAGIRALSGVGDYTAGAIASFAFDLPYPAVDGNVLRVAARLLGYAEDILSPKAKKELTAAVWAAQPKADAARFNQAMIELGATVCLPNGAPRCDACPLAGECAAHREGREGELPVRKKQAPRKKQARTVLIFRLFDTVALRQRPKTGLLAGLFEPFCLDGEMTAGGVQKYLAEKDIKPLRIAPLGEAKHIFTHIEWQMQGFEVALDEKNAQTVLKNVDSTLIFAPREEIDENYALPSAYAAYRAFM